MQHFIDFDTIPWHDSPDGDKIARLSEVNKLPQKKLALPDCEAEWIITDQHEKCYRVECNNCHLTYMIGINIPFDEWKACENRTFCGKCGRQMRKLQPEN